MTKMGISHTVQKLLTLIWTALLLAANGVAGPDMMPETIDKTNMVLSFAEEFDGISLNTDIWSYDTGNGFQGWGNWEKQFYTDRAENVQISDGVLRITAKAENIDGYSFSSGRIRTQGNVKFGRGYVEARIRLPSEEGVWPAFWMLGEEGTWPLCGEIDILESKNTEETAESTLHWADETSPYASDPLTQYLSQAYTGHTVPVQDKTAWHTYGVYRTETQIAFYMDGVQHFSVDITDPLQSELHQDYYVLFNVACGGNYTGDITPSDTLNAEMVVDYLRYYTVPEKGGTASPSLTFIDIPTDSPYAHAVAWCAEHKLMNGVGDNRFSPDGTLDRRTLATTLYRAKNTPSVSGNPVFTDVEAGTWYSDAVVWANTTGLMRGYGDERFGTTDPVTQTQMEMIIRRYRGEDPAWPNDPAPRNATRAEVAVALYTLLGEEQGSERSPPLPSEITIEGHTVPIHGTSLSLKNLGIRDLTPLAGLTGLTELDLAYNHVSDLTPLAGLTNLEHLDLAVNDIRDLTPLAGLTSLKWVNFWKNHVSDLTPLAGLTTLTDLDLEENRVTDLSPLKDLTNLTFLSLGYNPILDITPLKELTKVEKLDLFGTQISDIAPLAGWKALKRAELWGNQIRDLTPLKELSNLNTLYLHTNQISDITPLMNLTGLEVLYLYANPISEEQIARVRTALPNCDVVYER